MRVRFARNPALWVGRGFQAAPRFSQVNADLKRKNYFRNRRNLSPLDGIKFFSFHPRWIFAKKQLTVTAGLAALSLATPLLHSCEAIYSRRE